MSWDKLVPLILMVKLLVAGGLALLVIRATVGFLNLGDPDLDNRPGDRYKEEKRLVKKLLGIVLLAVFLIFLFAWETAYRPKNEIHHASEGRVVIEPPAVRPSDEQLGGKVEESEEAFRENREQNEKAREEWSGEEADPDQ